MTHLEFEVTAACGSAGKSLLVLKRPENSKEGANFRPRDLIYLLNHKY